jgi:hypothetical protein
MQFLTKWRALGLLASLFTLALGLACIRGGHHTSEGGMQVFNDGNVAMTQLFVTRTTSPTWGVDQLAPDTLNPGESLTLTRLNTDLYDVRAHFSDGSSDEVYDVLIVDGFDTPLSMRNSGNGAVAVFNNTGLALTGVYLTPASATTWGPNQTDQPVAPAQTLTLTGIAPATYDLRVVFTGGATADYKALAVTSGTTTHVQVN